MLKRANNNHLGTYVVPQIKEMHHPVLLQEWKLNIDAAEYEKNIKANMYKPSEKKKFNRVDSDEHWPTSIKKVKFSGFLFLPLWDVLQIKLNKIMG